MKRPNGGGRRHIVLLPEFLALLVLCGPTLVGAAAGRTCSVNLEGRRDGSTRVSVACAGEILIDETISEPKETPIPGTPLILFESAPNVTSFVRISKDAGDTAFYLVDSVFADLVGTEFSVAPLVVDDLRVRISNSEFKRNSGFKHGAISMAGEGPPEKSTGFLVVSHCTFVSNQNGVIKVASIPAVDVVGSTFIDNHGPALQSENIPELTIDTSNFTQTAKPKDHSTGIESGGDGNMFMSECTFIGHRSTQSGGAVSWTVNGSEPRDVVLSRCLFYGNSATMHGGAVRVEGNARVQIEKSGFGSNGLLGADGIGGAVSVEGAVTVSVADCIFKGNSNMGGSLGWAMVHTDEELFALAPERLVGSSQVLEANGKIVGSGGALAVADTKSVEIKESDFYNNLALYYGGSIFVEGADSVTVSGVKILKSTASTGGGIHISETPNVTMEDLALEENSAEVRGGGIAMSLGNGAEAHVFLSSVACSITNSAAEACCIHINGSGKGYFHMNFLHVQYRANYTVPMSKTSVAVHEIDIVIITNSVFPPMRDAQAHLLVEKADSVILSNTSFGYNKEGRACELNAIKSTVHITDSKFKRGIGGGLSVANSGDVQITYSEFSQQCQWFLELYSVGGVSLVGNSFTALRHGETCEQHGGANITDAGNVGVIGSTWLGELRGNGRWLYMDKVGHVHVSESRILCSWSELWESIDASTGAVWLNASNGKDFNFWDNTVMGCQMPRGEGAGIWFAGAGGFMNVSNSRFEGCAAKGGGAIKATRREGATSTDLGYRISVHDTVFAKNSAGDEGGSLSIDGAASVDIRNTSINESTAGSVGGGISLTNVHESAVLSHVEFARNIAERRGGSLYINGSNNVDLLKSSIKKSTAGSTETRIAVDNAHDSAYNSRVEFHEKRARVGAAMDNDRGGNVDLLEMRYKKRNPGSTGGGVHLSGVRNSVYLSEVALAENTADVGGSAYIDGANTVDVYNSSVKGSNAKAYGGGVHITNVQDSTVLSHVEFVKNRALWGGSLSINRAKRVLVLSSSVKESIATVMGGGIDMTRVKETAVFGHVVFASNRADFEGGSLYIGGARSVTVFNSSIQESTAGAHGGGISVNGVKEYAAFDHVKFTDNNAESGSGGGIRMDVIPNITFRNATFDRNSAGKNGGGLLVTLDSNGVGITWEVVLKVLESNFTSNTAATGGAFNFEGDGKIKMVGDRFDGNSAQTGGVAFLKGDVDAIVTDSYLGFNQAQNGYEMGLCGVHLTVQECHVVVQYLEPDIPTKIGNKAFKEMPGCPVSRIELKANTMETKKVGSVWMFLGLRTNEFIWVVVGISVLLCVIVWGVVFLVYRAKKRAANREESEPLLPPGRGGPKRTAAPAQTV